MSEDIHKERALQFLKLVSSGKVDEAYEQFVSSTGRHHSAYFSAGFDTLKAAMKDNYKQFPEKRVDTKHVVCEGDMVAVHSHVILKPGDSGLATLHLFRFENGRIVEWWDFAQPVPEESPNADGLF